MNRIKYLILFIEAVCIVVWFSRLFIEGFTTYPISSSKSATPAPLLFSVSKFPLKTSVCVKVLLSGSQAVTVCQERNWEGPRVFLTGHINTIHTQHPLHLPVLASGVDVFPWNLCQRVESLTQWRRSSSRSVNQTYSSIPSIVGKLEWAQSTSFKTDGSQNLIRFLFLLANSCILTSYMNHHMKLVEKCAQSLPAWQFWLPFWNSGGDPAATADIRLPRSVPNVGGTLEEAQRASCQEDCSQTLHDTVTYVNLARTSLASSLCDVTKSRNISIVHFRTFSPFLGTTASVSLKMPSG